MVSGNAENKSAFSNGIFLKVDSVEPVYTPCFKTSPLLSTYSRIRGIKVWIGGEGHLFECDRYTICDPEAVVEGGHTETLKLLQDICDYMPFSDRRRFFGEGNTTVMDLIRLPYDKIAEGYISWNKEKEDEEKKIRVRDEVVLMPAQDVRFVITKIIVPSSGEDAFVNGFKKDGTAIKGILLCNLKKTGLHVDDLDSYLEV